jgi:hypothetical protein
MTAIAEPPGEIEIAPVDGRVGLAQKLVEVARQIDSIEKAGHNRAQNYDFATAESIITDVRGPLLERGVLVLAGESALEERLRATSQGGETAVTTVHLTFTLLDSETGAMIELPWLGRGEDPMDKGVSKALTNALKTFLRQQFLLPWAQDDPEADEGSDARAGRGSDGPVANLIEQARGLNNAALNAVLVKAGLPAQQAPFGFFMRIPAEKAVAVKAALIEEHGS